MLQQWETLVLKTIVQLVPHTLQNIERTRLMNALQHQWQHLRRLQLVQLLNFLSPFIAVQKLALVQTHLLNLLKGHLALLILLLDYQVIHKHLKLRLSLELEPAPKEPAPLPLAPLPLLPWFLFTEADFRTRKVQFKK